MDARELRARTAWGLIAKPADPLAWHLQQTMGPEDALAQVMGTQNLSRVALLLEKCLNGLRPHWTPWRATAERIGWSALSLLLRSSGRRTRWPLVRGTPGGPKELKT